MDLRPPVRPPAAPVARPCRSPRPLSAALSSRAPIVASPVEFVSQHISDRGRGPETSEPTPSRGVSMNESEAQMTEWIGRTAYDQSGKKIGRIEAVYADDSTGRAEWLAVKTGMFGGHASFVP